MTKINKTTLKKYNIEEVKSKWSGRPAWKVSNKDIIKAYVNNDYDWYAENFLSFKFNNEDHEEKLKLAKLFIKSIIAQEFACEYLNKYYKENINLKGPDPIYPTKYSLNFVDNQARFQYSEYADHPIQSRKLKLIQTTIHTTDWNSTYEQRFHSTVQCKWSKYDYLKSSMGVGCKTDTIILLTGNTKQVKLRIFRLNQSRNSFSWDLADVTGQIINDYYESKGHDLDVTEAYNKFLAQFKN